MIRLLINGCMGRMGQAVSTLALQDSNFIVVGGVNENSSINHNYIVYENIEDFKDKADVIIDFSVPTAIPGLVKYALSTKTALVIATTGLSSEYEKLLEDASKSIPVFRSANMSLGVNLLINLVKKATQTLIDDFDIEIIEKHHNQKIDAPSGTAYMLADSINSVLDEKYDYIYDRHSERKKRSNKEIGIHAIRGGNIVGEHTVIFAGMDEVIELKHSANSRNIFAKGALNAAKFISTKDSGFYTMQDLINEVV
jgi:4-hydroxy-tetrahydrodipicolinate reductase